MHGFSKIAVASTFSPRFLPLLAEAKAFSARLGGGGFRVITVGECGAPEKDRFAKAFAELGIDPPPVDCVRGEPVAAILKTASEQGVDLLIAGALEKDTGSRNFVGDVARTLMRDSPISLLLFPRPSAKPDPFRKLAVVVDFSDEAREALEQAIFLAERYSAESIHVLRIFTIFDQALSKPDEFFQGKKTAHPGLADEEEQLKEFIAAAPSGSIPIEGRCIEGTTGFAASDFVQAIDASLLIIPSASPGSPHLFPQGMDWIFNVIPTNLLVVRRAAADDSE
jgi:nucleotide-binding universal stress UspA family protein